MPVCWLRYLRPMLSSKNFSLPHYLTTGIWNLAPKAITGPKSRGTSFGTTLWRHVQRYYAHFPLSIQIMCCGCFFFCVGTIFVKISSSTASKNRKRTILASFQNFVIFSIHGVILSVCCRTKLQNDSGVYKYPVRQDPRFFSSLCSWKLWTKLAISDNFSIAKRPFLPLFKM